MANEDQIEKLADTAQKNPIKALYWVLFLAISILGSCVLYMYREDNKTHTETIRKYESDRENLKRLLDTCNTTKNEEVRRFLEDANRKLEKQIQDQKRINKSH